MRDLLIGDMHIGIKNNSLTWLESQLKFFDEQIYKTIEDYKVDRIFFLGDLHDIRYSVNQQIGIELLKKIREMITKFKDNHFYFIAGNHDYYSPLEEYAEYNIYNLLFGEEFLEIHKNVTIIWKDPYLTEDKILMLPWYWTENQDHIDELLYNYDFARDVKAIFCHTDLSTWPGARIAAFKGCPIYSGHIHFITEDDLCNLHNIGAAVSLTFNDVNQDRYLYILEDYKITDKIKNVTTPKFKRVYNEDIFDLTDEFFDNSFVQLCISSNNINKAKYVERITELKNTYLQSTIRLHVIDDSTNIDTLSVDGFSTDIKKFIIDNIPDNLQDKFEYIDNKLKEK
jgi:hypothetical protein